MKEPAVATRKNFDPSRYSPEEIYRIKLDDGTRIQEDTKVVLDMCARDILKPIWFSVLPVPASHARAASSVV